jgi:hypothetical protein
MVPVQAWPATRMFIPALERVADVPDEMELDEVYATERQLLYAAATRARDRLLISGVSPGSEFVICRRPTDVRDASRSTLRTKRRRAPLSAARLGAFASGMIHHLRRASLYRRPPACAVKGAPAPRPFGARYPAGLSRQGCRCDGRQPGMASARPMARVLFMLALGAGRS